MPLKTIINGIDVHGHRVSARAAGEGTGVTVRTEWLGGTQTRTLVPAPTSAQPARYHSIDSDYPHILLGSGTAPSPVELLLAAIGSSFTTSFAIAAALEHVRIESMLVHAGARNGADEAPSGEQRAPLVRACELAIEIDADAPPAELKRISTLALADCSVLALCHIDVHLELQVSHDGVRDNIAQPTMHNSQANTGRSET